MKLHNPTDKPLGSRFWVIIQPGETADCPDKYVPRMLDRGCTKAEPEEMKPPRVTKRKVTKRTSSTDFSE